MYNQLIPEQRSQIFALLQNKTEKKVIASIVGVSVSTIYREIKRNSTAKGHYLWDKAQAMADARKKRSTSNSCKEPELIWEALFYLEEYQWSPKQISGYLRKKGKQISHECIYQHIRGNERLEEHCRHKMKYNRHGRKDRTTKVKNIPNRVSIHDRPVEANGKRFGDWEMDTIIGKNGKGTILTLTERSTNFLIACKLKHGKNANECAKAAVAQLFAYRDQIYSITTDNGSEFCAHEMITAKIKATVFFADSYSSWQKGAIENANKLLRQYIPKSTDFNTITEHFLKNKVKLINERPREKLDFDNPKNCFFRHFC